MIAPHDWHADWRLEDAARSEHRIDSAWTDAPFEGEVATSIAISLKRIADAFDSSESGGRVQGSVLWWLETIASAAQAGRA